MMMVVFDLDLAHSSFFHRSTYR